MANWKKMNIFYRIKMFGTSENWRINCGTKWLSWPVYTTLIPVLAFLSPVLDQIHKCMLFIRFLPFIVWVFLQRSSSKKRGNEGANTLTSSVRANLQRRCWSTLQIGRLSERQRGRKMRDPNGRTRMIMVDLTMHLISSKCVMLSDCHTKPARNTLNYSMELP